MPIISTNVETRCERLVDREVIVKFKPSAASHEELAVAEKRVSSYASGITYETAYDITRFGKKLEILGTGWDRGTFESERGGL